MVQDPVGGPTSFSEPADEIEELDASDEESSFRKPRSFRKRTSTELEQLRFRHVNERVVNDITLDIFYKPHTLTVLALLCAYLLYKAFSPDAATTEDNVYLGLKAVGCLFLVISAMAFPNGPFIRPHPLLWRLVFGVSVLYALLLQFALYQKYADIKSALSWLDPKGLGAETLVEKEYAINCSDISVERVWSHMDIFAVGHFLGWGMKALLIRHNIICWYISIMWEVTEVVFAHLLPNFKECWWDAIFLDIILCNGLGILFGMSVCKVLEMRSFHWESIRSIPTARGKFKRAVLQFTPESWLKVEWMTSFAVKRILAIYAFIMIWMITELNTFFLKHVFAVDTTHPVVFWRIILIGLISAPSIRQYYLYATDPKIKRMGMQCWIYLAVCALEAAICVKFGREILPPMKMTFVAIWCVMLAIGTGGCVWLSVRWAQWSSKTREVSTAAGTQHRYVSSSSDEQEYSGVSDDLRRRRKRRSKRIEGTTD
ncbi:CRE-PSSY-1 protein, partial [Aphelenchoides avenae]